MHSMSINKTYDNGFKYGIALGIRYLAIQLKNIAIQNYGCSKQDWIDKIYSKIQEALKGNVKEKDYFHFW